MLLTKTDKLSGMDPWITRTYAALTPELRHRNELVIQGLYHGLIPERSFPSFEAYVDDLAAQEPTTLRDRILAAYAGIPPMEAGAAAPDDLTTLLDDKDTFLRFLMDRFPVEHINTQIEAEAFEYLKDPDAMQALIVTHLQEMWETVLAIEWRRVQPMLQASAEAFQQVDLSGLTTLEAVEKVSGQSLEDCKNTPIEQAERIIFVPSAHVGPYMGMFKSNGTIWLLFGARLPEGSGVISPDLSRAEILVRLGALADDTRLRILKLVTEEGEQSSKDIMTRLALSQSAASRHLKQLSATGYIDERRCEGAKCYTLNPDRIENTLRAIAAFFEI
jgi:DNA-binding transcriptional ArsR family regulator